MPVVIRKISPFCSLRLFSPTSLQRAKNACFSLIFPEKSAFWNGFELRRFDVKKSSFFDFFLRFAVESSSDNFRFLPENSVSCGIDDKTLCLLPATGLWVGWMMFPARQNFSIRGSRAALPLTTCSVLPIKAVQSDIVSKKMGIMPPPVPFRTRKLVWKWQIWARKLSRLWCSEWMYPML